MPIKTDLEKLILPNILTDCLDFSETAYFIAYTRYKYEASYNRAQRKLSVPQLFDLESFDDTELEISSKEKATGYFSFGIPTTYESEKEKTLSFFAKVEMTEKSVRRSSYSPPEDPTYTANDTYLENLTINVGDDFKELDSKNFGNYPDFSFDSFRNILYGILDECSWIDIHYNYKQISLPSSIENKILKYSRSKEYLEKAVNEMKKIPVEKVKDLYRILDLENTEHKKKVFTIISQKNYGL